MYSNGTSVTVAALRLDKYEVTVGRFRRFVAATVAGWTPAVGSGKHAELPAGGIEGESGWASSFPALPTTTDEWAVALTGDKSPPCSGPIGTWTVDPGPNESRPIVRMTWYEAYAFCIWDGGFLPTEREWEYAAAGGAEQRYYPWSANPQDIGPQYAVYGQQACLSKPSAVGSKPLGAGLWGHMDLAGNAAEWTLDGFASPDPLKDCTECAYTFPTATRSLRGGAYGQPADSMAVSLRYGNDPQSGTDFLGVRCARTP